MVPLALELSMFLAVAVVLNRGVSRGGDPDPLSPKIVTKVLYLSTNNRTSTVCHRMYSTQIYVWNRKTCRRDPIY